MKTLEIYLQIWLVANALWGLWYVKTGGIISYLTCYLFVIRVSSMSTYTEMSPVLISNILDYIPSVN